MILRALDADRVEVHTRLAQVGGGRFRRGREVRRAGAAAKAVGAVLRACALLQLVRPTSAVVVLQDGGAVVEVLAQAPVHLVVDETPPHGRVLAGVGLGRELLQQLDEVPGTVSAGVHLRKGLDVRLQVAALPLGGLLRIPGQDRVEELPCCVAQLRLERLVPHLRHERDVRPVLPVAGLLLGHQLLQAVHLAVDWRVRHPVAVVLDLRLARKQQVVDHEQQDPGADQRRPVDLETHHASLHRCPCRCR